MEQLQENIHAFDTILSDEIIAEIEKIQELIPNQRLNSEQFSVSVSSIALKTETNQL